MKAILAFSLLGALLSCADPVSNRRVKNVPGETIREYERSYSGTMMWYIEWFRVDRGEDGKLRLAYSYKGPEITIIRCPDDALMRIDGLVREYKLWNLKNSYVPRMRILDGHMWSTYIRYEEASISTGGSNAWPPKRLSDGLSAIDSYVKSIIDASGPEDVIGTDSHKNR